MVNVKNATLNGFSGKKLRLGNLVRKASFGAALSLASLTNAHAADYEMIISHVFSEDPLTNEVQPSLMHFESLVETATNGAIDVKIFGGSQLGSEVESGKAAQKGLVMQGAVMSSGAMSSFYKDFQVMTAPFLFPNYLTAWAYFDGPYHADFMKGAIEESGLRYMGTFDEGGGFVAFTNNKHPIRTVEDIEGLRIRVEENPAHIAIMKALGASATPLPWGEVQTALATGLADGQFNAPGISKAYKLYDVNDYTTLSGHVYNTATFMISEKWFQSLPEEYRVIIANAARESMKIGHGIAVMHSVDGWDVSCKEFKECIVLSEEEKAKMAAVAMPAWREWITKDFGVDPVVVDGLMSEVQRLKAEEVATSTSLYAN
ncbi:TRAP transporter substrate-binding protein DctP [Roseibium algae]|uniref:TRAP transporter substrate-binding protein DctP n=1 Tax=Roseibium algae TaxID=3123038 RepID=A0ABU8TEE9_9HYPH